MKYRRITMFFLAIFVMSFGLPKKILKKVNKAIETTYDVEEFSLESISISKEINTKLTREIKEERLFKIISQDELIGYAYIDQAPSKTATFDFLVLFDTNLIVTKSKVLIYREEYGGEIGSKRWLKQFIGSSKDDNYKPNDNIIAIAGATISVNSMTNAMNEVLQNVGKLRELNIL